MNSGAQMTQNANLLLEYFGTDSIEHVDSLRGVWQLIRTPAARYAEALTYMQQDNFDQAQAVIEALPEEHVLKVKQESERWRMLALIDFLRDVKIDGRSVAQLTTGEQNALQAIIAEQRDRPATWAQNILCFHYGICRAPLTGDAGGTPKSRKPNNAGDVMNLEPSLRVYPNPASKHTTVEVRIMAALMNAVVVVQDISGREVQRTPVKYEGQQLLLDTRTWPSGSYAIRLENNGAALKVERLVVEQ